MDMLNRVIAKKLYGGGGGSTEEEWYITDASYMFYNGARLVVKDFIFTKLKYVTTMYNMFCSCTSLTELDVSKWDTSKVTDMSYMFFGCTSLTELDVSKWDTSKVTTMGSMFQNCNVLEQLIGFSATRKSGVSIGFPRGTSSKKFALSRLTFRTDLPEGVYSIRSAINIPYCSFERDGMVEMFNTLPDVSGLGLSSSYTTITITGNPCVTDGSLTAEDEAIATAKGWTLVK